jgi:hypothetical protein
MRGRQAQLRIVGGVERPRLFSPGPRVWRTTIYTLWATPPPAHFTTPSCRRLSISSLTLSSHALKPRSFATTPARQASHGRISWPAARTHASPALNTRRDDNSRAWRQERRGHARVPIKRGGIRSAEPWRKLIASGQGDAELALFSRVAVEMMFGGACSCDPRHLIARCGASQLADCGCCIWYLHNQPTAPPAASSRSAPKPTPQTPNPSCNRAPAPPKRNERITQQRAECTGQPVALEERAGHILLL